MVSDEDVPHVSGLYQFRNVNQFKADLEFFLRFYTPVCLQDIIRYLDGTGRLPKRCFLPTFDDGFREIYDVISPILYAQGIPAVFFLTTSAIDNRQLCYPQKKSLLIRSLTSFNKSSLMQEASIALADAGVEGTDLSSMIRSVYYRQQNVLDELGRIFKCDFTAYTASVQPYLTSKQIRDLIRKGFEIGAHSVDHPLYSELCLEEQLSQTRDSLRWLSGRYHYDCRAFAFPYSDAGISLDFFQKAFADSHLKVTFGTGGILRHFFPRNVARFSMERTDRPAELILARQFGRSFLRRSV